MAMTAARSNQDLGALVDALEAAGIFVAVEIRDGSLVLSGEVDSAEMHQAALDLAGAVARGQQLRVEDAIGVLDIDIDLGGGQTMITAESGAYVGDASSIRDVGTNDAYIAADEGIAYFPPTDPVVDDQADARGNISVIGGFQTTSLQGDEDESTGRSVRGDEQISDDVRRELREDATTTDLDVQVDTRNGTVVLLGEVETLEDAENAEAVAARVPGVRDVRESLTVHALQTDR
jgi:osmotically-inducible protein OsmY